MGRLTMCRDSNHDSSFVLFTVVVDDFYRIWSLIRPRKANPILLIDANAVLAFPASSERL
jgi:hypothetical protein